MRRLALAAGLLCVFALAVLPAAFAEGLRHGAHDPALGVVRTYPGPPPCNSTLQTCLNAGSDGDLFFVAANTYITNPVVINHAITLQGLGATPGATVLRALGAQRVISVGANIAAGVLISNFTILSGTLTSGSGTGAGIVSGGGTPLRLVNLRVLSNTNSVNSGGGIFAGDAITLINVDLIGNRDAGGAGGGLRAGAAVVMSGGSFQNNFSFNPGGALRANGFVSLSNVLVLTNSIANAGTSGGGIRADGGLWLSGGLVANNVAPGQGGGIFAAAGAVISGAQVISNSGTQGGGLSVSGSLVITNSDFEFNEARTGDGGSIYSAGSQPVTLAGTTVTGTVVNDSHAAGNGGGLFAAGDVLLNGNVAFDIDSADGEGGGIYAANVGDAGVPASSGELFAEDSAGGNGGAIRALGSVNLVVSPTFGFNGAGGGTSADGGALYADGDVTLANATASYNVARDGGAIFIAQGVVVITGSSFAFNTAADSGGAVYANSPLTATQSAFISNTAVANFGGNILVFDRVTLGSVDLISGTAGAEGGGLLAFAAAINGGHVDANRAGSNGGGLLLTQPSVISGTEFSRNAVLTTTANGLGGAVGSESDLTVTNGVFLSNTVGAGSSGRGGAIAASLSLALFGGTFQNNQAGQAGGVTAITATLSSVSMTHNSACCVTASGGALSATLAVINGGAFIQNTSVLSGGAVIATRALISGSAFLTNTQAHAGGALWVVDGGISNTLFVNNRTTGQVFVSPGLGGAVFALGNLSVAGSGFDQNSADIGGALYAQQNASVARSRFADNSASMFGGALDALGVLNVYTTTLERNHAGASVTGAGGAINALGQTFVQASLFISNAAGSTGTNAGGAIAQSGSPNGQLIAVNSLFAHNNVLGFSPLGAAIILSAPAAGSTLFNNTFYDQPRNAASAIEVFSATVLLDNNIIAGFTTGIGVSAGGTTTEEYTLFFDNGADAPGAAHGGHSFDADPRFLAPAQNNFHLRADSPAVDHGRSVGVAGDFEGDPRPLGAGFDIGFDELRAGTASYLPLLSR